MYTFIIVKTNHSQILLMFCSSKKSFVAYPSTLKNNHPQLSFSETGGFPACPFLKQ